MDKLNSQLIWSDNPLFSWESSLDDYQLMHGCFDADGPGGDGAGGQNADQNLANALDMNEAMTGQHNSLRDTLPGGIKSGGAETAAKSWSDPDKKTDAGKKGADFNALITNAIGSKQRRAASGGVSFSNMDLTDTTGLLDEENTIGSATSLEAAARSRESEVFGEYGEKKGGSLSGLVDSIFGLTPNGIRDNVTGFDGKPLNQAKSERDDFFSLGIRPGGGNTQSPFGGDNNQRTSKQAVARSGSQAVTEAKVKAIAGPTYKTKSGDLDGDYSLYRRMLSGYFKGARI